MTLHAALAIGAPMVWTLTEGSVQSSPASRVPTALSSRDPREAYDTVEYEAHTPDAEFRPATYWHVYSSDKVFFPHSPEQHKSSSSEMPLVSQSEPIRRQHCFVPSLTS